LAGRKTLLVEGIDDEHVLKHICGNRGLHLDEVKSHGGVDELLSGFAVSLKLIEEGDVLGLVVDADADLASRWQSVRQTLLRSGYPEVPPMPHPDGTILAAPFGTLLPRVGVWLMPDNATTGILEDFLQLLVPDASWLLEHARSSVRAIPETERRFKEAAISKAIVHTWLAWQEEPGKPLGTAITARYLDPFHPAANVLASWLGRLFVT
jgi:hypothetical protein